MRRKKEINWRIGANIQAARENARYTQEQLSERLGITPNHLSAVERGAAGASLELIERLCLTLGISADYLFFGELDNDNSITWLAQQLSTNAPEKSDQIEQILSAMLELLEPSNTSAFPPHKPMEQEYDN